MKRSLSIIFACFLFVAAAGCSTIRNDAVTQISLIDAILAGAYDGQLECSKLLAYGDFGIGTFHGLDGEMVMLDGVIYKVRYDGSVQIPPLEETTPFASAVEFSPDKVIAASTLMDMDAFKKMTDKASPNQNVFCAIKVTGSFKSMHTRSVPPQKKPYPPLVEVTKNQPEFHFDEIKGTIVGFRSPSYAKGVGVPGYHLHFLSDDKKCGGHILSFELESGTVEIDECNKFLLIVPQQENHLSAVDFNKDRSSELERAESAD